MSDRGPDNEPPTWRRVSPSPADFERDAAPGAQALATECVLNLLRTRDQVWARVERIVRRHGIPSPAGFLILTIVDGAGTPLHPSEISRRMFVTAGTMTGLIATLEKRGLVTAARSGGPGPRVLVSITEEGRRVQKRAVRELDVANVRWFACFSEDEKLLLLKLLAQLDAYLSSPDSKA